MGTAIDQHKINALNTDLTDILPAERILINEPLKNHTSFRIGGPADMLVMPGSIRELGEILRLCSKYELPVMVIGNGTNLVVSDKGIRGVVIKLFDNFNNVTVSGNRMEAEAGALLSKLAAIALKNSLEGLEFASGIPGTLGGGITMNAGAYGGEMKDVVVETTYMDFDGKLHTIKGAEHCFGYRNSIFQKEKGIILRSVLQLKPGSYEEIKDRMDKLTLARKSRTPMHLPSAGSVFKRCNIDGMYTWKLIDEAGLRGYRIGGAQVSEMHCGFIVNTGDATASDVIELIRLIQQKVREKFDIELQTEVKIVGEI